jgi:glycosyltransferase involved in cell wall biosynthesis
MRTLYLCYFGLRECLVQTQVLPYLRALQKDGVAVFLLTFEPDPLRHGPAGEAERWSARLAEEGIHWRALPYHKRPSLPATVFDIAVGGCVAARMARRHRIDVFHARAHVAAAMGLVARSLCGGRLLFDIRGFVPDEYVDAGAWSKNSLSYRLLKRAERGLLAAADGFVVLTEAAREILFPGCSDTDAAGRPIEVIPCCVDAVRFRSDLRAREQLRHDLGFEGRRVLIYVGALGGWYLTEEIAAFLAAAREQDPSTFCVVLTQSEPELLQSLLRQAGVPEGECMIRRAAPEEVPAYLRAADLGFSFIKPCYSKLSSSPTKIPEYLASGLPVICNAGIGDTDRVIERDGVGVIVREWDRDAYLAALDEADRLRKDPDVAARCRESAHRRFDLETVGGARYRRLYRRLCGARPGRVHSAGAAP